MRRAAALEIEIDESLEHASDDGRGNGVESFGRGPEAFIVQLKAERRNVNPGAELDFEVAIDFCPALRSDVELLRAAEARQLDP